MDPQLKMMLTSVGSIAATAVASWAASKGIISAGDQANLANSLLTVAGAAVAGLLAWYAHRQTSQPAMIKAVNAAPNGATVVKTEAAAAAGIPAISEPVKP